MAKKSLAVAATEGSKASERIRARIVAAGRRFHANDNIAEFIEPGELNELLEEVAGHLQGALRALVIDTESDHNTQDTARRVAKNGSLASPHIRTYTEALLRDLCGAYPELHGLRVDWPEYPPYLLDSAFVDFSLHAEQAAGRLGIDFERMRADAGALYRKLHGGLTDADLRTWAEPDGGRYRLLREIANRPGLVDFLRFKAMLVDELLAGFRRVITEAAGKEMELMPNAFPPPFTLTSGMDYARAARHSSAISVKLYTMHWPMILRFHGEQILKANPGLSSEALAKALVAWFDIADDEGLPKVEDYTYPPPDAPHPVGAAAQARKIRQAQADAGRTPVYTLVHGYGPLSDFRKRLEVGWRASEHGIWLNRYGYLTDEKLDVIGEVCRGR